MARNMIFMLDWQKRYPTSERSERMRYNFRHNNIKFISLSQRVMLFLLFISRQKTTEVVRKHKPKNSKISSVYFARNALNRILCELRFLLDFIFSCSLINNYVGFDKLNFSITRHLSASVWQRLAAVQWRGMMSSIFSLVRIWKVRSYTVPDVISYEFYQRSIFR